MKNTTRSQQPKKAAQVTKSTLWGAHFLPQNREVFASCGGNGTITLFKSEPQQVRFQKTYGICSKNCSGHALGVPTTRINIHML